MTVNGKNAGLLVGYGSIGWRHARALASMTASLAIVEPKAEKRETAREAHPSALIAPTLEALDEQGFAWTEAMAVIASWGPSHAEIFQALADRGVKRILCEKPMAASVADAEHMRQRAQAEAIALGVHHFIRFAGFAPALRAFAESHGLGEPVAVVVEGGAAGLITNGVHWIDFATQLFGADPMDVISTAYGEGINPRSPDVMLYGGTAVWRFPDQREAIISFSNRSSVGLAARIYYRNAVAETDSDAHQVAIRARDPESVARFPSVTRRGPASELLFEGVLPGVCDFDEALRRAHADIAQADVSVADATVGARSVSSCVGMLLSSREGRAISLPIDPDSAWGRETWPIS